MNEIDSPIASRRYTCFHPRSGVKIAAMPMPTQTRNCCSSESSSSDPDAPLSRRAAIGRDGEM